MTKAGLLRFDTFLRGIAVLTLALSGVGISQAAQVAIGSLQLTYSNGFQQLSFFNLTGPTYGCDGVEYEVCNGITVDSWNVTLTFTSEGDTDPATDSFVSPLSFASTGLVDAIGPYNGAATGFTGGASGTWQIPLNFGDSGEPACPPCDYELTQVEFSGTIDPADLPLYVGSDPNNFSNDTSFNAQSSFDSVWVIPSSDYYNAAVAANPGFFGDANDVLISDQQSTPPGSGTPEPSSLFLLGGGIFLVVLLKRLHAKAHFGCVRLY